MLGALRIGAAALSEHQAAWCPAEEGQLHRVSVSGQGEGIVPAENFGFPIQSKILVLLLYNLNLRQELLDDVESLLNQT